MNAGFHIEVYCHQQNHQDERICGDVFLSKRLKDENRLIAVLADGMGHGVKANILATLTATMALNFTEEHKDISKIAEIIMNTLPVCSERKMSYSTFTVIDIEIEGETTILQYDNPKTIIMRGDQVLDPGWACVVLDSEKNAGKEIKTCRFKPQKEDRIIFSSDGIAQSGLGSDKYPFGWGEENMEAYVLKLVGNNIDISARKLASKMVTMANHNDEFHSKDDTSCGVIYYREPRNLLVCSGPPFDEENDKKLGKKVKEFNGKKIVSGATTGDIISRELNLEVEDGFEFDDPDLPPVSFMQGIDLFTEGILTLGKVSRILEKYSPTYSLNKGPADEIVKLFLESDAIHFIIGTKINEAHQDPSLPLDLEIRRTVIKRIIGQLETKFLKEVSYEYI